MGAEVPGGAKKKKNPTFPTFLLFSGLEPLEAHPDVGGGKVLEELGLALGVFDDDLFRVGVGDERAVRGERAAAFQQELEVVVGELRW